MKRAIRKPATEYGKWILKRLIDKGMTITQLADEIGVTQSMVSKIIYGDTPGNKQRDAIMVVLEDKPQQKAS
ncbi:MAG: helix-turn-helix transcriptional regulator [Vagococcus sp.]